MKTSSNKLVWWFLYSSLVYSYLLKEVEAVELENVISVPNQFGNLSDYLCGTLAPTISNGTTMELDPNVKHVMSGTLCTLQGRNFITIRGSANRQAVIECSDDDYTQISFSFVEMRNFTMRNIRFENCGGVTQDANAIAPVNTSPIRRAIDSNQHAVLFLARCIHVTIQNVTFNKYRGYAVYGINLLGANRVEQVTVTNSFAYISGMRSSSGKDLTYSGSGMFFHFSDRMSLPVNEDGFVLVTNSTLSNNFNIYPEFYVRSLKETRLQNQQDNFPLHGCGGLTVHFEQRNRKVMVFVENTHFLNNGGSAGGGSQIVWRNTIDNSDLLFSGCTFTNNRVVEENGDFFIGGGLQLYFTFDYSQQLLVRETVGSTKAIIRIENSVFRNHSGVYGAALAIFTEAQNVTAIKIELASVQFENNRASKDGDCIYVDSENSAIYSETRPSLILENILVNLTSNGNNDLGSIAALSFTNIHVTIFGSAEKPTIISNGRKGGLKLFNTFGFLTGEVHFRNNSATKGGAITMEDNSYIFFKEPANIHFVNNKAVYGGAIYSDIVRGTQCVMQFISRTRNSDNPILNSTQLGDLNITLTFIDNEAERDGKAIYAQPIFKCSWFSESIVQIPVDNLPQLFDSLYDFQTNETQETYRDQVRSHPFQPCVCEQNGTEPVCVPELNTISIPPGRSFLIPIVPVDELQSPLQSVVLAEIFEEEENTDIRFQNNQANYVIDLNGSACYPLRFVLHNKQNTTAYVKVNIQNVVGQSINSTVNLESCPFGFELNTSTGICDCVQIYTQFRIKCDIEKAQFIKTVSSYWIGRTKFEEDVPACVLRCPSGYCQARSNINITFDNQCNGNRYNEICGKCKPGYSMQFGTTDCQKCSNYWLFTIILYILAGVFLVVFLFLFKLTITEGLLGSILFYVQLFSINIGLLVYSNETRFTTVFISLLNLELGFPLCFYNGMTQVAKAGLQYIFPVYLWLLVALITLLSRYSNKIANLIGSESAKVFVSLIYFSYTKLQRTAVNALIFTRIRTNTNSTYFVWFYDGGERYFHGRHLILALVSMFFLLFILTPYLFGTLFSQWFLHNAFMSRYFKPLIDATLAPFKDRWRFWFGLRLLVINILILIIVFVSPLSFDAGIYAHLVVIFILIVCQANIKPYKSKLIHYLDLFFLINYIFFLIGCLFIFGVLKPTEDEAEHLIVAVEVLIIGSAFAVFIFTIACHVILRVKKFIEQKKKGKMTPKTMRDELDTEMEVTTSFNSTHNKNNEPGPQNVTLTVVDIRNNDSCDDGSRLRESLLASYN